MTASTTASTSASTTPRRRADGDVSAVRVFARACAAEWTRLWSVKATWWFLAIAAVVMVGLGVIAGIDAANDPTPPTGEPAWTISAISTMPGQFALLALALLAVTSDYATGGIVPTLQWTPRRTTFFAARAVVSAGTATILGVLLALGSALAAWVAASGFTLPVAEGVDTLGSVAFVLAAGTTLSVGLGFLLRNAAGGLVTGFLTMVVLPVFLPQFGYVWMTELGQVLPGSAAAFLLLGEVPGMSTTSSVGVLLSWAVGAMLLGWLRLIRDDVNR